MIGVTLTNYDEAADCGQHDLPLLDVVPLDRDLGLPAHLPQSEEDAGVEDDQGEQRDEAVDDEVHVDDINLVIVTILTKTCANNNQILRTKIKGTLTPYLLYHSFYLKCLIRVKRKCRVLRPDS